MALAAILSMMGCYSQPNLKEVYTHGLSQTTVREIHQGVSPELRIQDGPRVYRRLSSGQWDEKTNFDRVDVAIERAAYGDSLYEAAELIQYVEVYELIGGWMTLHIDYIFFDAKDRLIGYYRRTMR